VVVEGRTGHIVPSGNDEALAAAVLNLLRNPELERFGDEGRRIVQERFSVEAQLRQTEDLYERLLSQK
jgi:glycosyltransferase involved in cell wall biosynthesis